MGDTQSDKHLTPAEIMAFSKGSLSPPAWRHAESCEECQRSINEWREISSELAPLRSAGVPMNFSGCPAMEELANFAGKVGPIDRKTTAHVLGCERCAAILQESLEEWPYTETDYREEVTTSLPIAPATVRKPSYTHRFHRNLTGRWMAYAAAIAVIAALGGYTIWLHAKRVSDPSQLLAMAYTERRPFEFRLADSGYGPVRQRKGAEGIFDKPEALARAENMIRQSLTSDPRRPALLALKGRAELMEGNYDEAIDSISRALEPSKNDPELLTDLGTALAARGEAEKRNTDYGHASELFLQALARSPDNERTLFNLAIVYEKLWMVDEAEATWRRFLAVKPAAGWRQEAEGHLTELEKIRAGKKRLDAGIFHDPAQFLAAYGSGAQFDPLPYYDIVWTEWLAGARSSLEAMKATRMVAEIMRRQFGDYAIEESLVAINAPLPAPRAEEGLLTLAMALSANREGRTAAALTLAADAARKLEAAGLKAAALFAHVELTYASRRAGMNLQCLRDADEALARIATSYPWLSGSAHLEHLSCVGRLAEADARAEAEKTRADLMAAQLWPVALRATAFICDIDAHNGNYVAVWDNAPEGLRQYWTTSASLYRAQSFQYSLQQAAAIPGWNKSAVEIFRASIRSSHRLGNGEMEATGRFQLAHLFHTLGDFESEIRESREVDSLLDSIKAASGGQSAAAENMRWEARLERAEAAIGTHPQSGLVAEFDYLAAHAAGREEKARMRLEQAFGSALYGAGDWQRAADCFRRAIEICLKRARSQGAWVERIPIFESADSSFRSLSAIELEHERDPVGALATWTVLRPRPGNSRQFITFALLPTGPVVWSVQNGTVRIRRIVVPIDQLQQASERFLKLCASSSSDPKEIRILAHRLYEWLVAPELRAIPSGTIALSADSWLAQVPFGALVDDAGNYLFQRYSFVENYGPVHLGWGGERPITSSSSILIVSSPSGLAPGHSMLPVLSAATLEASQVEGRFRNVLLANEPSPEFIAAHAHGSQVLHFLGHGWANGGNGALILSPAADRKPRFLTALELAHQDLSRCQLAVLSACLTAAGEERGAVNNQSLVQALLSAGARRVVAARWSVDSEATRALMDVFYAKLLAGSSPAEALAGAAMQLAVEPNQTHPYFWAGFDLFGEA